MKTDKPATPKAAFAPGDVVVYPGHGVGTVTSIESQRVGEHELKLFVISFEHDRMTLRVPTGKVKACGLRGISSRREMDSALAKLKQPASQKKAMWNRRAVEYTAKINSGNPELIAEVVRDLYRGEGDKDPSHGERVLYEQAFGRLTHELAAIDKSQVEEATAKVQGLLLKAA